MKRFLIRVPIFLWLLIFSLIQIFLVELLLPSPFNTYSYIPLVMLSSSSIHIADSVTDSKGNYAPMKHLWWWVLALMIFGIVVGLILQLPFAKHVQLLVQAILGGIGYRFIEHYAVYRYHYLHKGEG